MSVAEILQKARELPPEERREVAETLLDELTPEESPEFLAELERRAEVLRKNPGAGIPLQQVRAELKQRLKDRAA